MKYLVILGTIILATTLALAQAPPLTQPSLPAIDATSLAVLKPIVAKRAELMVQLTDVQAQFRIAQQAALATAKLDPLYHGVVVDPTGTIKFVLTRPLPNQ